MPGARRHAGRRQAGEVPPRRNSGGLSAAAEKDDDVKRILNLAVAGVLWAVAAGVPAQQYPARPITMLCWSAAGSPVDLYARMMAKLLAAELGQNIVVDNRTGGSGIVMVNLLLRAPADGYTVAANTITLATLFSEAG